LGPNLRISQSVPDDRSSQGIGIGLIGMDEAMHAAESGDAVKPVLVF
jgi:hypothetical protein